LLSTAFFDSLFQAQAAKMAVKVVRMNPTHDSRNDLDDEPGSKVLSGLGVPLVQTQAGGSAIQRCSSDFHPVKVM
jgi:hypothetical protein